MGTGAARERREAGCGRTAPVRTGPCPRDHAPGRPPGARSTAAPSWSRARPDSARPRCSPTSPNGWTDGRVLRVHADSFESDLAYATVETLVRGLNGLQRAPALLRPVRRRPGDDPLTVGRLLLDAIDADRPARCAWSSTTPSGSTKPRPGRCASWSAASPTRASCSPRRPGPRRTASVALFDDVAATTVNHARIDLTPLTVGDTQELARHILGPRGLPPYRDAPHRGDAGLAAAAQRAARPAARDVRRRRCIPPAGTSRPRRSRRSPPRSRPRSRVPTRRSAPRPSSWPCSATRCRCPSSAPSPTRLGRRCRRPRRGRTRAGARRDPRRGGAGGTGARHPGRCPRRRRAARPPGRRSTASPPRCCPATARCATASRPPHQADPTLVAELLAAALHARRPAARPSRR